MSFPVSGNGSGTMLCPFPPGDLVETSTFPSTWKHGRVRGISIVSPDNGLHLVWWGSKMKMLGRAHVITEKSKTEGKQLFCEMCEWCPPHFSLKNYLNAGALSKTLLKPRDELQRWEGLIGTERAAVSLPHCLPLKRVHSLPYIPDAFICFPQIFKEST